MSTKKAIKIIVSAVGFTALLMAVTQPARLPPIVLMVPFICLFIALMLVFAVVLSNHQGIITARNLRGGAIGAVLPMLLLVLRSLGQLTPRDVIIMIALFAVAAFYMAKRRPSPDYE